MSIIQVLSGTAITIILCSCTGVNSYNQELNNEVGHTRAELLSKFGRPSRVYHLKNGDEIIAYIFYNKAVLDDKDFKKNHDFLTENKMYYPFTYGGEINLVNDKMENEEYCNTKFYLQNNEVTSWQWRGNGCSEL